MNTLEFRAWHKKKKTMIYDVGLPQTGYRGEGDFKCLTHMQYTGFSDDAGQKLYVGDILEVVGSEDYPEHSQTTDVIQNVDGQWQLRTGKEFVHGLPIDWGGFASMKKIGNIYENPELLNAT